MQKESFFRDRYWYCVANVCTTENRRVFVICCDYCMMHNAITNECATRIKHRDELGCIIVVITWIAQLFIGNYEHALWVRSIRTQTFSLTVSLRMAICIEMINSGHILINVPTYVNAYRCLRSDTLFYCKLCFWSFSALNSIKYIFSPIRYDSRCILWANALCEGEWKRKSTILACQISLACV